LIQSLESCGTMLQKQDDCQHESPNSAAADMEGELLINMVTRAVTAIMSRLNTLSNSDVPESKVWLHTLCHFIKSKSKAIPITGHGCLYISEMLRIPHCLDSRLTDGGKVVSPTHRPRSTPQRRYFSSSGTHFC
jgi:hypothetical protein